jgi:8-oxo-dGTP diphosphatase
MGEACRMDQDFNGAKVALFIGEQLLVILRDDDPSIPFPNLWDFPGGGREGNETPFETLAREVREEVGLDLPHSAVIWDMALPWSQDANQTIWFFVARLPIGIEDEIIFGDEGQRWDLMTPEVCLTCEQIVPSLASRLQLWMSQAK